MKTANEIPILTVPSETASSPKERKDLSTAIQLLETASERFNELINASSEAIFAENLKVATIKNQEIVIIVLELTSRLIIELQGTKDETVGGVLRDIEYLAKEAQKSSDEGITGMVRFNAFVMDMGSGRPESDKRNKFDLLAEKLKKINNE
jgi:hypothetical protein